MLLPFVLMLATASPQACPADPPALPASLQGWRTAAAAPGLGTAFPVRGVDPTTVRGLTPQEVARGGTAALVAFEVDHEGTYRVALSDVAWVDVYTGNEPAASIGHGHGPACSGIRKIVDFRLHPGRYSLHLSGMKSPMVRVLIARA
jgi:hypothetical protein